MNFSQKKNKKCFILLGPPNSGKTTLFNWLTGFKHRVVNYPGSTVLLSVGDVLKKYNLPYNVTDTPGVYSLFPQSEDEQITHQFLLKIKKLLLWSWFGFHQVRNPIAFVFQLKEAASL